MYKFIGDVEYIQDLETRIEAMEAAILVLQGVPHKEPPKAPDLQEFPRGTIQDFPEGTSTAVPTEAEEGLTRAVRGTTEFYD
jgi:hypothetical protein